MITITRCMAKVQNKEKKKKEKTIANETLSAKQPTNTIHFFCSSRRPRSIAKSHINSPPPIKIT